jgi:hypothetical protein
LSNALKDRTVHKLIAAASMLALLASCAGRTPAPVSVSQIQDGTMSCQAIQAESRANNSKISELGGEQGAKTAQNVAAGVAGLFIWPLWFAMDFQGAATKEIAALEARNAHLGERALEACTVQAQFETRAPAPLPVVHAVPTTGLRKVHEPRVIPLLRE